MYEMDNMLRVSYKAFPGQRSKLELEAFPFSTYLTGSSNFFSLAFKKYLKIYFGARKRNRFDYNSYFAVKYFSTFDTTSPTVTHIYSQFNKLDSYGYLRYADFMNPTAETNLMTAFFTLPEFRSFFYIDLSFKPNNLFVTAYSNPRLPKPTTAGKTVQIPEHAYSKFKRGSVIANVSSGSAGFKGPKRTTTIAAYEAGKLLATKLIAKKISQAVVVVQRFNNRILGSVLRGLADDRVGFKVLGLDYQFRVPHSHGLRAKKVRRV